MSTTEHATPDAEHTPWKRGTPTTYREASKVARIPKSWNPQELATDLGELANIIKGWKQDIARSKAGSGGVLTSPRLLNVQMLLNEIHELPELRKILKTL